VPLRNYTSTVVMFAHVVVHFEKVSGALTLCEHGLQRRHDIIRRLMGDDCTAAAVAGRGAARQGRHPRADDVVGASRHGDSWRTGGAADAAGSG